MKITEMNESQFVGAIAKGFLMAKAEDERQMKERQKANSIMQEDDELNQDAIYDKEVEEAAKAIGKMVFREFLNPDSSLDSSVTSIVTFHEMEFRIRDCQGSISLHNSLYGISDIDKAIDKLTTIRIAVNHSIEALRKVRSQMETMESKTRDK